MFAAGGPRRLVLDQYQRRVAASESAIAAMGAIVTSRALFLMFWTPLCVQAPALRLRSADPPDGVLAEGAIERTLASRISRAAA